MVVFGGSWCRDSGSGGEDEASGWTLTHQNVHDLPQLLHLAQESAIIQIPGIKSKVWQPFLEEEDKWVENKGKEESSERISLVKTSLTGERFRAKQKVTWLGIAGLHPSQNFRKLVQNFGKGHFPIHQVKGIDEVALKEPERGIITQNLLNRVDYCLAPPPDSYSYLEWRE